MIFPSPQQSLMLPPRKGDISLWMMKTKSAATGRSEKSNKVNTMATSECETIFHQAPMCLCMLGKI